MNVSNREDFDAKSARTRQPLPLWAGAFDRATMELSPDIIGAYVLILIAMWESKSCDLPANEHMFARIARVSPTIWRRRFAPVLLPMLVEKNGRFFSEKLQEIAGKTEEFCRTQHAKKSGKSSHNPLKNNEQVQSRDLPEFNRGSSGENPKPLTSNQIKEEEDAQARGFDSDFLKSLRDALGVQSHTAYWSDLSVQPHVDAWRAGGLTDEAILSAAKASRDKNPSPPDGPKALDRWMEQAARAGQKPKPSAAPTKATEADVLAFWAERINGDGFVAPSSITPITARRLVEAGLVQPETLKRRGIAA